MRLIAEEIDKLKSQFSDGVIDGVFRDGKDRWDDFDSICYSRGVCFGDLTLEAAVMLFGWSNVPAIFPMESPRGSFKRFIVDNNFGFRWEKGVAVEIVCTKKVGLG